MGTIIDNLTRLQAEATLIFHHIPKTAGSTLDVVLDANYAADTIFTVLSPVRAGLAAFKALTPDARRRLRVVRGHGVFGLHAHLEQPCLYATLLRDPLDRVVSQYYFIRNSPDHPRHAALMAGGRNLAEYLEQGVNPMADNGQVRALAGREVGDDPQAPYGQCPRDLLEAALVNLKHYALVGITDRFDAFLVLARRALGWHGIGYSRRKVTQRRPAVAALTSQEQALLRHYNALDVELYRMATERFQSDIAKQGVGFGLDVAWFQFRNRRRAGA